MLAGQGNSFTHLLHRRRLRGVCSVGTSKTEAGQPLGCSQAALESAGLFRFTKKSGDQAQRGVSNWRTQSGCLRATPPPEPRYEHTGGGAWPETLSSPPTEVCSWGRSVDFASTLLAMCCVSVSFASPGGPV